MQIFINITATFILAFWPIMFMMSPMMFDAPGSDNDRSHVISLMLILCYPIGLFGLLWVFGFSYFGISSLKLALVSCLVIALGFSVFGYFDLLFNSLRGIANSGYSIVEDRVYYNGKPMNNVDSDSFTVLSKNEHGSFYRDYARDRQHVYYRDKVIEGAVSEGLQPLTINHDTYWINDTQVIYDDRVLQGANPDHFAGFEGFRGWTYSKDDTAYRVYSYGNPLPAVDRDSFTPLDDFYARDKDRVYYKDQPILAGADAASFELLDGHSFGRDKNHVYYLATNQPFAVPHADPDSFEVLERGYMKDKNHVYVAEQYEHIERLEQADAASFEVTRYDDKHKSEARDINYFYYDGKIVAEIEKARGDK